MISMMDSLFDEEYLRMQYDNDAKREYFAAGKEEGIAEGRKEGTIKTLLNLFIEGLISKETAEKKARFSIEKIKELADKYDPAGTLGII